MRIAYFDCAYGVAGDMIMGALVDAGAPFETIREALENGLGVAGLRVKRSRVTRSGVSATKVDVEVEAAEDHHRCLVDVLAVVEGSALPPRVKARAAAAYRHLAEAEAKVHETTPETIHFHEVGALDAIADVAGGMLALELLGIDRVEVSPVATGSGTAKCAHGVIPVPAPATVELLRGVPTYGGGFTMEMATPTGAAVLAAVAAAWGAQPAMAVEKVGYGSGTRAIPGHANFLRVMIGEAAAQPVHTPDERETVPTAEGTPTTEATKGTGAHAHPHPHEHNHPHPHGHAHSHAHGHSHEHPHLHEKAAASAEPISRATADSHSHTSHESHSHPHAHSHPAAPGAALPGDLDVRPLTVLMTEVDDMSPEIVGDLMARLFAAGCLDAHFTAVQMKKNRPGTQIQVLCDPADKAKFAAILLRETSTFGLKAVAVERFCLARRKEAIKTALGTLEVKIGLWGGEVLKVTPEYESCRRLAEAAGLPLTEVYARALVAIRAHYHAVQSEKS